ILYLYSKGYRNFLFFVNLSQVVKKTVDNFLNPASSKYLFAQEINIDGKTVHINQVSNFQECNPDDINILFDTTAGLHSDMTLIKENSVSIEDFLTDKTVLIADEAHHLNTSTLSASEQEDEHSWEITIKKIRESNIQNIMLEFTATCDIGNPLIKEKYEDKIIFDYNLAKFRADKYSKDIFTLRSDFDQTKNGRLYRSLQAMIVSQYKLKRFQELKLNVKPVILFKSKTIKESMQNKTDILEFLKNLSEEDIEQIRLSSTGSELMKSIFAYFTEKNISGSALVSELKLSFNEDVCIDVNDNAQADSNQLLVNSLEDEQNPYRMLFEVKKLDEGWDCLNLFDIVRLYETNDSKNMKPGKDTTSEAQLIGRGARYYPFEFEGREKYQRKFDSDVDNPFRICEQLHYHCENDSRYISVLNAALKEYGITDADEDQKRKVHNEIKKEFLTDDFYLNGYVFQNRIVNKTHSTISDISEIKDEYFFDFTTNGIQISGVFNDNIRDFSLELKSTSTVKKSIKELVAEFGYNFVHSQMAYFPAFTFDSISKLFPDVKSVKEFVTDVRYLGNKKISVTAYAFENKIWNFAIKNALAQIAIQLSVEKNTCNGSKVFTAVKLKDIFTPEGTFRNYPLNSSEGDGIPQSTCSDSDLRFDLTDKNWYVYKDNYGTTEEKRFVKYFAESCIPDLEKKYSDIKLIRNECQVSIFDFNNGRRFEPDFLLFLKNKDSGEYEYTQVFIEPKGKHLLENDKWKEEFLLQLEQKSIPTVEFKTDGKYKIWGLHFYSHGMRDKEFREDMEKLSK
ncbi:DEAD/DEAH box helicase family protein, partial [Treponema sp.]|uniref:DEAD/DEAH box helicase family protein n=1 Tax=Treponema sp. TaxID=166 RepID=UPI00298D8C23